MTKKTMLSVFAGAVMLAGGTFAVLTSTTASADEGVPKDCHLEAINGEINSLKTTIKSSPAYGHAGGHYKNALEELEKLRTQLQEGCRAWNKDANKGGGKAK
jgi:hypothetical protein